MPFCRLPYETDNVARRSRRLTAEMISPARQPRSRDHAALLTPQKNGSGPFTIPVTFARQA